MSGYDETAAMATAELGVVLDVDQDLDYIAGAFGDDALDEVITAICLGTSPTAAIAGFTAEMDELDEFFEGIPVVASRALVSPVQERCAA